MKRSLYLAVLALSIAPITAVPVMAADKVVAAPAAKAAFTTADTDLGTLLDNPAAKAVLAKYIATMISNPQIDMARTLTLRQLQAYAGDMLTDDILAKIDADLAQLK